MVTPTDVSVIELRRRDLLATAARDRFVASASRPTPPARGARRATRLAVTLRQAVASLIIALVS